VTSLVALADSYLVQYLDKIELATAALPDAALWWRANERSNSIANLVLHLRGNLSLWILAGLGGEPFERHRAAEFAARDDTPRDELLAALAATVARCRAVLARLAADELDRERRIQGYAVDGWAALLHAVEHMSYHTGQILAVAKQLAGEREPFELYPRHRGE
jgi:uncharacterized damage-inducible protein DinB